ncbi:MFS transporter [Actinotalea solisilvae]|uniref:MFS transporter n=1 Tax=Actinotalea solisilvae TaxID=2072922 RepID=UPI0018F248CA|nr:MFS transporter [Actinotalea solisilvae]
MSADVPTRTAHDGAPTSPWAPGLRGVTVAMLLLVALNAFEALAVTTTMPTVVDALGGLELYAMAFAAPVASSVVGMVLAGMWSDRRGPGGAVLAGVALFVAGLAVAGTAPAMPFVVAGRVVQGLGSGMIGVALYVLVARVYPDRLQARVFAAFAAAWVLPAVVGPALAGLVSDTLGWRWVFLGVPLLALPAAVALRPALTAGGGPGDVVDAAPSDADPGGAQPPARRRLPSAVGAGGGALALHWAGQQDGAAAGAAVLAGLVLVAVSAPALLPRGSLRLARGLPTVVVLRGLFAAGFFGAEVFLPLVLVSERGLRPAVAGLALTTAAVLWSTGSWLRGRQEGRWSDPAVLRVGGALLASGIALGATTALEAVPVAVGLVGWGLSGLGMGMVYPTLSLLTLRLSAPAEQGANSSSLQLAEALTVALVLAVSGPLFAALHAQDVVAAYLTCFGVAAALALGAAVAGGRVRTAA